MSKNDFDASKTLSNLTEEEFNLRCKELSKKIHESVTDTVLVGRIHHIDEKKGFFGNTEKLSLVITNTIKEFDLKAKKTIDKQVFYKIIIQDKDAQKYSFLQLDDLITVIGCAMCFSEDIQAYRIIFCASSRKRIKTDSEIKNYLSILEKE